MSLLVTVRHLQSHCHSYYTFCDRFFPFHFCCVDNASTKSVKPYHIYSATLHHKKPWTDCKLGGKKGHLTGRKERKRWRNWQGRALAVSFLFCIIFWLCTASIILDETRFVDLYIACSTTISHDRLHKHLFTNVQNVCYHHTSC